MMFRCFIPLSGGKQTCVGLVSVRLSHRFLLKVNAGGVLVQRHDIAVWY